MRYKHRSDLERLHEIVKDNNYITNHVVKKIKKSENEYYNANKNITPTITNGEGLGFRRMSTNNTHAISYDEKTRRSSKRSSRYFDPLEDELALEDELLQKMKNNITANSTDNRKARRVFIDKSGAKDILKELHTKTHFKGSTDFTFKGIEIIY